MIYQAHEYQTGGVQFIEDNPRSALLLDMGLGKTSICLTAVRNLIARGEVVRVLIVAPKRVAERTWTDEAEKWDHTSDLKFSLVMGSAKEREAALNAPAHIYLTNRENVKWLVERFSKVWPFDMIIIDESSSFKDPGSQRFRALRKVSKRPSRVVILSGTPTPNTYLDLWSQFFLVNPKILGRLMVGSETRVFRPTGGVGTGSIPTNCNRGPGN